PRPGARRPDAGGPDAARVGLPRRPVRFHLLHGPAQFPPDRWAPTWYGTNRVTLQQEPPLTPDPAPRAHIEPAPPAESDPYRDHGDRGHGEGRTPLEDMILSR